MKIKTVRKRLDQLLVERDLAESLTKARAMILAGEILVDGQRAEKSGLSVTDDTLVLVKSRSQKYSSRGGLKLEGALDDFVLDATGKTCLDVGSSTGGFTDCLLQHGASKVYAVDVTMNQLAWKLQQDPRVICLERNARELNRTDIPEPVDFVVVDVSFISLTKVLPPAAVVAKPGADLLLLVKPQFELRRQDVGPGGIVKDKILHEKAIAAVRRAAEAIGLQCVGVRPSRITGAEGNQEYFLHARKKALE